MIFSVIENECFGLVFAKTGSINLGTASTLSENCEDAVNILPRQCRITQIYTKIGKQKTWCAFSGILPYVKLYVLNFGLFLFLCHIFFNFFGNILVTVVVN